MTPAVRTYSAFPALLLFFVAVTVMDMDQILTVHRKKLALMQQYEQALKLQQQVGVRVKLINGLTQDVLRLAASDPEASAIVAEFHLRPVVSSPAGK